MIEIESINYDNPKLFFNLDENLQKVNGLVGTKIKETLASLSYDEFEIKFVNDPVCNYFIIQVKTNHIHQFYDRKSQKWNYCPYLDKKAEEKRVRNYFCKSGLKLRDMEYFHADTYYIPQVMFKKKGASVKILLRMLLTKQMIETYTVTIERREKLRKLSPFLN